MVFGIVNTTKLQNDVFCLTEERDYFQTKFLEQVSEIAALKDEFVKIQKGNCPTSKRIMEVGSSQQSRTSFDGVDSKTAQHHHHHTHHYEEKKDDDLSSMSLRRHPHDDQTNDNDDNNENDDDDANSDTDSAKDIRQSAEKLLQWASYRSSQRTTPSTPDQSTVSSTPRDSLLDQIPRTIGAINIHGDNSDDDDDDDVDHDDDYDESDLDDDEEDEEDDDH